MRIVLALGGNALLRRGEPMTAAVQSANLRVAAGAIAPLVWAGHQVVITHGNGPQIGLLALQNATADDPYPLDVLGAETDGMIGYLLERALANELPSDHLLATVLTQIKVDRNDPAFARPTKPIGPTYDEPTAKALAAEHGWSIAPDGKGWRRVVASPRPVAILEARVIELLVDRGVTVICGGGGGIPVVESETGSLDGVEAVVDKDFATGLIARLLRADRFVLLTDVAAVFEGWGTPDQRAVPRITARGFDASAFPAGSMRPKIEAAIEFANETGRPAAIGSLENVAGLVDGTSGTQIVP